MPVRRNDYILKSLKVLLFNYTSIMHLLLNICRGKEIGHILKQAPLLVCLVIVCDPIFLFSFPDED